MMMMKLSTPTTKTTATTTIRRAATHRTRVIASAVVPQPPRGRAIGAAIAIAIATSSSASAFAAVECNLVTPCTPPPPNGEPRYTLPGAINSPGEDAVARYMAKLEAAKGTPAPAVESSSSPASSPASSSAE